MRNELILRKIIEYSEKILHYCKDNTDKDSFMSNSLLVEACVFNLSQIGEITNKLDTAFTEAYPEIPWYALYGLRNRIVHDYEGVNLNLIWDIIHDDLPSLLEDLKNLV